jgi:hypothetical protein
MSVTAIYRQLRRLLVAWITSGLPTTQELRVFCQHIQPLVDGATTVMRTFVPSFGHISP